MNGGNKINYKRNLKTKQVLMGQGPRPDPPCLKQVTERIRDGNLPHGVGAGEVVPTPTSTPNYLIVISSEIDEKRIRQW